MNYQKPYKYNDINIDNIVYTKVKNINNRKIIYLKYNNNSKLNNFVIQTPILYNIYEPEIYENYCEFEVALKSKNNNINNFVSFINKFEQKIKSDILKNYNEWFNINNTNNVSINFHKIIHDNENYEYGTIKLKTYNNNNLKTLLLLNNSETINIQDNNLFINNNNNNININVENCWTKIALEFYGIWTNNDNEIGIYIRPIIMSFDIENNNYNYKLLDDDTDEETINIPETDNNIFINMNENITNLINNLTDDFNNSSIN